MGMQDRRSKIYGGSQHQGSQLQCRAVRITSAPPMSEGVFPPPNPRQKDGLGEEGAAIPGGHQGWADGSGVGEAPGFLLRTVLPTGLPGTGGPGTPKRALSSKSRFVTIKFLVLIPNHPILSVIPQTKSDHIGMLCKQPCLGGPEPRHPQHQPQHQVCYKKTDLC